MSRAGWTVRKTEKGLSIYDLRGRLVATFSEEYAHIAENMVKSRCPHDSYTEFSNGVVRCDKCSKYADSPKGPWRANYDEMGG